MAKENSTRTTRLSGELDERYENYRDELDMTDAEALRSLIRDGLSVNEDGAGQPDVTALEQAMFTVASVIIGLNFLLAPLAVAGVVPPSTATLTGIAYLAIGSSIALATDRGVFRFGADDNVDDSSSAPAEGVSN